MVLVRDGINPVCTVELIEVEPRHALALSIIVISHCRDSINAVFNIHTNAKSRINLARINNIYRIVYFCPRLKKNSTI